MSLFCSSQEKKEGQRKVMDFDFALRFFINKKFGNRQNKDHLVDNFKSFYNKCGLSFFDFQLFY